MTAVVRVETDAYEAASRIVGTDVGFALDVAGRRLSGALSGSAGMAGSDATGSNWAEAYDRAAAQLVQTSGAITTACFRLAGLLEQTGFNYVLAESASTLGKYLRSDPDRTAWDGVVSVFPVPPSAAGGTDPEPAGWSLIASLVGYVWPNGHQDRLRAAASAWHEFGLAVRAAAHEMTRANPSLEVQDAPETPDALAACRGLADQLTDLAGAVDELGAACAGYAAHLDAAHAAVRDELESLVDWTIGIEAAGAALSVISLGASEAAAQAAEAARIAAAAARITAVLSRLADLARAAAEYVANLGYRGATVADQLCPLLTARIMVAAVDGAEPLRLATSAAAAADQRLARVAAVQTKLADLDNPKLFDPQTLRGLDLDDLHDALSARWGDGVPSRSGDGWVYEDPVRRGRQVRLMPGYGPGVRPNRITEGPYVVTSQNGRWTKVPLAGNPVLK